MIIKPGRDIQLNRAHPLARGLVGCWLFNEGTGDKIFDLSLNGNEGTLTNMDPATDWVAGKDGWALDFDGVDDYVLVSNAGGSILNPSKISIVSSAKSTNVEDGVIVALWDSLNTTDQSYMLWLDFPIWEFIVRDSSSVAGAANSVNNATTNWTNLCGTYDGETVKLYVDGLEVGSNATPSGGLQSASTDDLFFGSKLGTNIVAHPGQIDYIFIYNRVLTASEVLQLYRNPYQMFDPRISPAIFGTLVAAGGLSIPIAMRYYRNRRTI